MADRRAGRVGVRFGGPVPGLDPTSFTVSTTEASIFCSDWFGA
ncbi:hypothetical protein SSCG_00917 [Streptomyces clavuligerus]|nr:hypothetical protein SSCG_00917 [Streptomyces clavuligerus]